MLPELARGTHTLVVCDDPCTTYGFGEYVQGWLTSVPTAAEAGFPGFGVSSWSAVMAPKGTPEAVIARLSEAIVQVLRSPEAPAVILDAEDHVSIFGQQTELHSALLNLVINACKYTLEGGTIEVRQIDVM